LTFCIISIISGWEKTKLVFWDLIVYVWFIDVEDIGIVIKNREITHKKTIIAVLKFLNIIIEEDI